MNRRLKRELNAYTIPPYDEDRVEELLQMAERTEVHRIKLKERMTWWEFIFDQLRFIRMSVWIVKSGLTILIVLLTLSGNGTWGRWFWPAVTIVGEFLCLANATELWGICCPQMMELHVTAKYSFRGVLLARMLFFGLADAVTFLVGGIVLQTSGEGMAWQIFLYGTVPYLVMCMGCIVIFRRYGEENTVALCGGWGSLLIVASLLSETKGWEIYGGERAGIWALAGLLALAGSIWQMKMYIKETGGNRDEIDVRAAV